jgi:hypothetical protein
MTADETFKAKVAAWRAKQAEGNKGVNNAKLLTPIASTTPNEKQPRTEKKVELFKRTRDELRNPAPQGERHDQAIKLAVSLLDQGLVADAVFSQLRAMYDADVSDRELNDILKWAGAKTSLPNNTKRTLTSTPARVTPEQAKANVERLLKGWHCTIADLWHASQWHPCEDWRKDAPQLIAALYEADELINIVTEFTTEQQRDGTEKACPRGGGKTLLRDDWLRRLQEKLTPRSAAGTWIRPNSVKELHGSGDGGAYTDADVASFRFLLLESDSLPIGMQLSLWARLKLPVAAIIDSGGRSVHAWVKVDCSDEESYRHNAAQIYALLAPFGICRANKNSSRLARLPGVKRKIGGAGACEQRLFYLNPSAARRPIFERL